MWGSEPSLSFYHQPGRETHWGEESELLEGNIKTMSQGGCDLHFWNDLVPLNSRCAIYSWVIMVKLLKLPKSLLSDLLNEGIDHITW